MPKRISGAETPPVRVVFITLDNHLSMAADQARPIMRAALPSLDFSVHCATDWAGAPEKLAATKAAIAEADILIVTMLFVEDHIKAVLPDLEARRERCDALVACMSASEVVKLTRIGRFVMGGTESGAISVLKRLRGAKPGKGGAGQQQMALLKRLPRILKFIPGTAQDVRAYFLTMQYALACSDRNLANLVLFLVDRYAAGPRAGLKGTLKPAPPTDYPDVGLYHPAMAEPITDTLAALPKTPGAAGTVGVLLLRSYILSGDTGHYDGAIAALEAQGLRVIPAFAAGLDSRPAVDAYFMRDGQPTVDAVVSLTSFSLIGGPAFNNAQAAQDMLAALDVPCFTAQALEFQTVEDWRKSERGLMPVESTIMVAIPELDGSIAPMVFAGRSGSADGGCAGCARRCRFDGAGPHHMHVCAEQAEMLASRVARTVALRRGRRADRKVAVVLFNFPPNSGAVGTAANLAVYESLFNTLRAMKEAGYTVELPADAEAVRDAVLGGNSDRFGTDANVHARIPVDDHVRREPHLAEIESQWGPAPGKQLSDGASLFVLGAAFGNVLVAVQPAFGFEGDPMRLLFEKGFAPTHAFSAFYRYLREDFAAQAVLHFGTHGALEFMPGKQTGLAGDCWPERLIGDVPNYYLYAANNPSEGTIAKRRSAATLISYRTPPIQEAGLYRELSDLKSTLDQWRALPPEADDQRARMVGLIRDQAEALDLVAGDAPAWDGADDAALAGLVDAVGALERTLIPLGLHVVGEGEDRDARVDTLMAMAETGFDTPLPRAFVEALADGADPRRALGQAGLPRDDAHVGLAETLARTARLLAEDHELDALIHALDGGYIRPVAGGDLLRNPDVLPTGRNMHGFDPFKLPSAFAVADGKRQADQLLARHAEDFGGLPESVALVLWGTDNLKTEGGPIGQALALMGATPRFDSFGRLAGAALIGLEELGRPRIDVTMTLSGIFRDLLPLQTKLLAEAAFLAAAADEPDEMNFIRKHALAYRVREGCDLETAALRVFSNDDGTYGSNVNVLVDSGRWQDEDELADVFTSRKSFAYGVNGRPMRQQKLMNDLLSKVDMAYQNIESVELGVTTIDHYFDSLGGIARAVKKEGGADIPVYIADQTQGREAVRSLTEQVALETRTRTLNPAWYEGMLKHGYEGVRQIEAQVTNTVGWSATTGKVDPWVYERITETFVLDPAMRDRLATLNPQASARVANRLLEAHERNYWTPDPETLAALQDAGDELEDRLEGINANAEAAA